MQDGVGHAVQRGTAGHGQHPVAGAGVQLGGQRQQYLLQAALHAGGQVGVRVGEFPAGRASRSELRPVHRVGAEAAGDRPDLLPDLVEEAGPAVGGQRHHLVFVAGAQEAEVGGQVLVEQAERVRQRLGGQDLELACAVPAAEERILLAATVADQHGALGRPRGQAGRGGVGDVVAHEAGPGRVQAGELLGEELRCVRRVQRAQVIPWVVELHGRGGAHQRRVVREADGDRRRPGCTPAWRRHHRAAAAGCSQAANGTGRLPCLRRLKRSSSAAATTAPSTMSAAAGSWKTELMPRTRMPVPSVAVMARRCSGVASGGVRGMASVAPLPAQATASPNPAAARPSPQATFVTAMFQRLFLGK